MVNINTKTKKKLFFPSGEQADWQVAELFLLLTIVLVVFIVFFIQVNKLMGKLRAYGLYRDEHADFAEEMERQRYLRWGKR